MIKHLLRWSLPAGVLALLALGSRCAPPIKNELVIPEPSPLRATSTVNQFESYTGMVDIFLDVVTNRSSFHCEIRMEQRFVQVEWWTTNTWLRMEGVGEFPYVYTNVPHCEPTNVVFDPNFPRTLQVSNRFYHLKDLR